MTATSRLTFGLLGFDPQVAAVATAALAAGDSIVIACDAAADLPLPALRRQASWQALLDEQSCDVVLVAAAGWNPARAEGVRTLVQAGRTLFVAQPAELSMLWAYELDMIRRDTGARLVPALADRLHPFIARLRGVIEAGRAGVAGLGGPESLTLVRGMDDRSREAVLAQLARDADLVRVLAGDPARLSTLADGAPDAAWPTLAVGLTGSGQMPVRWQVTGRSRPGLTITLQHATGTVAVWIPDAADEPWTWRGDGGDEERMAFDRGAALVDVIHAAVGRETAACARQPDDALPPATWADASRAIELAETVPRSLVKGRAIDLHREEFSEIGTFKGTMASLGCAIVLGALFVLVVAAVLGVVASQMREEGQELQRGLLRTLVGAWPFMVLAVMVLFLAIQVLPALLGLGRDDDAR
jgi:predicted dehydrogenase